jgi:hypothetical protein
MSLLRVASLSFLTVAIGCANNSPLYLYETSSGAVDQASECPKPPDLAPPAAKCAAAAGLPGTNLICVDFSLTPDQTLASPLPQSLNGWSFAKDAMNNNDCWQVLSGKLQVIKFSMFASNCTFYMPALSQTDYNKYNTLTLSVVHKVDLNEQQQKIQLMLGNDDPLTRLVDQTTGKQPRKQWVHTITKGDLPPAAGGMFQPLFKLTSNVMVGNVNQGWQIESIAVMGSP